MGLEEVRINIPMFHQTAGLLAMILGLILFFSSFNIKTYLLNIVLIIYLRFAIQIILIINIFLLPEIAWGLITFGIIDFTFAISSLLLIKSHNLSLNILNIIKKEANK
jgi:hypothetical protein